MKKDYIKQIKELSNSFTTIIVPLNKNNSIAVRIPKIEILQDLLEEVGEEIVSTSANSSLNGLDAILSTLQMPAGVPVATFAAGKAGATNAGIFAAQMLAASDEDLAEKIKSFKAELREKTILKDKNLDRD